MIVDLAAERGGNCELTSAGETVVDNGVTIIGPVNLPATVPNHASQMYARNIVTFLKNMMTKEGELNIDINDEITRDSLVVRDGDDRESASPGIARHACRLSLKPVRNPTLRDNL